MIQEAWTEKMRNCSVSTCCNRIHRIRDLRDPNLHFFRFPKDPALRAIWLEKCARKERFNAENAAICSAHFLPEDYDPSYLVKKSVMPNALARLRKGAVPSLHLPDKLR